MRYFPGELLQRITHQRPPNQFARGVAMLGAARLGEAKAWWAWGRAGRGGVRRRQGKAMRGGLLTRQGAGYPPFSVGW